MYATIAAEMAAETADPGRRVSLLEMAQAWRALADKEEGSDVAQQQEPDNDEYGAGTTNTTNEHLASLSGRLA
jgi:hypothetical protein